MSDTEQLFGREATEQAQGFQPMPEPVADKPDPELERDEAIVKWIDDRAQEARPIVERQYVRADDESKSQPDNRTVELDRAAEDLAQNRMTEAAIAEVERDLQLANEIDAARGLQPQPEAQQPEAWQPEAQQQQTEQQQAGDNGLDPEVAAALRNPKILSVLQQEHSAGVAKVDTAINYAAQWAQTNAEVAAAAILSRPELRGIPAGQLPGALAALAKANPEAAQQIQSQINQVQILTQQAAEARTVQQQRAAIQFQAYGAAQDDAFEKSLAAEPPETVRAIKETAMQMMREAGLTDQQLAHEWNNNALLRSAQGQSLLADAARWRMMKSGIANKAAPKQIPAVVRPGTSVDRPDAAGRADFAVENKYSGNLNPKQAAELLTARRARNRR
jgi:hypothetical protein